MNVKLIRLFLVLLLGIFLVSFAFAKDVVYVVENKLITEPKIINSLNNLNLSYDVIGSSQVQTTNFSKYKMILLGNNNVDNVPVDIQNSLVMDFDYSSFWAASKGFTTANLAYNLYNNPITIGIENTFVPYTQNGPRVNYLSGKKSSIAVTTRGASSLDLGYFVVARKNSPRSVLFGINEPAYWTAESQKLFENSVHWVVSGADGDGDGFYLEEDCNDTDPQVNPGSLDLSKNCRNDAPMVEDIEEIIVNKTETAEVLVEAVDYENDDLTYSVKETGFGFEIAGGGILRWNTTGYSSGRYTFTAVVSDGEFETLKEFKITVLNRAPICLSISDLTWPEDTNMTINLNNYCDDLDGDYIVFALNETSQDTHIGIYSLIEGVASFSVAPNWFGEDWIIFLVGDLNSRTLTNKINLIVTPVNDAPKLIKNMTNLTWEEDSELTIDLSEYFFDVENNLTYIVNGNYNINISINNNLATLTPKEDWFGDETVTFSANDSEFEVSSNEIFLNVNDINEMPEFEQFTCETKIFEDVNYECQINATDDDNDNLTFSINLEENLNCNLNENNLSYMSHENYYGNASCTIEVTDGKDFATFKFETEITNVNDGPFINSFSPTTSNPRILLGESKNFSISISDIDNSNFTFQWLANNVSVGNISNYTFRGNIEGNYNLKAVVSDGNLTDIREWSVFVGGMGDFTCREVGGFMFTNDQICQGNLLDVLDTQNCCSIQGSTEFLGIDRCSPLSSNVTVDIMDPTNEDEFSLDDLIRVRLRARHNLNDSIDFEIKAYIYDLVNNQIIDDNEAKIEIGDGENGAIDFGFESLEDYQIDINNDFAVFVKITDGNEEFCQEDYVDLNILKEDHDILLKEFDLKKSTLSCGDHLDFDFTVQNTGKNREDITILVENKKMKISAELEEFELEEGEEEKISSKEFDSLYIPSNLEAGEYIFDFTADYNHGEKETISKTLTIQCGRASSSSGGGGGGSGGGGSVGSKSSVIDLSIGNENQEEIELSSLSSGEEEQENVPVEETEVSRNTFLILILSGLLFVVILSVFFTVYHPFIK